MSFAAAVLLNYVGQAQSFQSVGAWRMAEHYRSMALRLAEDIISAGA